MTSTLPNLSIPRENMSLRQQVVERMRAAILSGQFAPGQKLVERDLCEMMDISRTVLREALQHLGAEGLINHVPHKGPEVARVSYQDAVDIYAVREPLEALAGAGFAVNASHEQIAALRAVVERLNAIDEGDASTQALLDIKNEFYAILLGGCGNAVVADMLTVLNNRITLLRRVSLATRGRLPHTRKELAAIMDAIDARDAARAKKLCAAHVRKAAAAALQTLR